MPRAGLSYRGKALLRTTSQSRRKLLDSSPSRGASGETVHFAGTAKASPREGRWHGVSRDGEVESSSGSRSGSVFVQPLSLASLDKAGLRLPTSAALRLRLAGRCPNSSSLFPPLAAVVAVAPSRGASGETVHFAGPCRRGYFSNRSREFVENARVKREEFVNVIKMRRRY